MKNKINKIINIEEILMLFYIVRLKVYVFDKEERKNQYKKVKSIMVKAW